MQQLWEGNSGQKDMMRILTDEGWDINESDLMRLRSRNGWLLRGSTGYQSKPNKLGPRKRKEPPAESNDHTVQVETTHDSNTASVTAHTDEPINSALAGMLEVRTAGLHQMKLGRADSHVGV